MEQNELYASSSIEYFQMWSMCTARVACRLLATSRSRLRVGALRTVSSAEFNLTDARIWDYLNNLKEILTKQDRSVLGNISDENMRRLSLTGRLFENAESLIEELKSLEQLKKGRIKISNYGTTTLFRRVLDHYMIHHRLVLTYSMS